MSNINHKCHQNILVWRNEKAVLMAMCKKCLKAIVIVRRCFVETVGHGYGGCVILDKPRQFCESYGYWAYKVTYPDKMSDILPNFASAIAHANYVFRNPDCMRPLEK